MTRRRPPALIVRIIAATFVTAVILLAAVFTVVTVSVRNQVREAVGDQLESSQRMVAAIETREQREMLLQAVNIAESPTLKAAVDTYAAESGNASASVRSQLLNTIAGELEKVAARVEVDAVAVVDDRRQTLAAAGRLGHLWRSGELVPTILDRGTETAEGIVHRGNQVFRVVALPLVLGDGSAIGSLYLGIALDRTFAEQLSELARSETAVVSDGRLIASTFDVPTQRAFEDAMLGSPDREGTVDLAGEAHAFRQLVQIGDTSVYALTSIDRAASAAITGFTRALVYIAIGALSVALLGSIWVAHLLSKPIGELSGSLGRIAASRSFDTRLPLTGSSLEVDQLTRTFNALLSSVAAAEAETDAAYTAAIKALATALDARDPYTAGHSERVSALAVSIGRVMQLPSAELEVLRLGALLHDIGKIGVPDEVLCKPGPLTSAEFDIIKQHPGLGARILRTVPFLARHVPIVELHHERPDGRGYPHGLTSEAIPLAAHIVHVADAYDAMTSARAYRRQQTPAFAMHQLWSGAGTEFHAESVAALATAIPAVTAPIEPVMEALSA